MIEILGYAIDIIIFALIAHWILGYIKNPQVEIIEKTRHFLNRIFNPVLDFIRKTLKPNIKIDKGRYLDFSSLILLFTLALCKRMVFFIF